MVRHLVRSGTSALLCHVERELVDVEKVLVSVAQRLDEGMYPTDQVYPTTSATDTRARRSLCHAAWYTVLPDKQRR